MSYCIDILKKELSNPQGSLGSLRIKLGITSEVQVESLSREKKPPLTFKLTSTDFWVERSWVVKLNPANKQNDSWYNVEKEYHILKEFNRHGGMPAPKPIYKSSAVDEIVVGTKFIIMEFVYGLNYDCVGEIPPASRRKALVSVMTAIAKVHNGYWYHPSTGALAEYDSGTFWSMQMRSWKKNYCAALGPFVYAQTGNSLFDTVVEGANPVRNVQRGIHGDLDISNVIFDDSHNVKVFVDWKYATNGDPMVDVAYFCMMFLRPQDYGYPGLKSLPLLIGDNPPVSEENLIAVYKPLSPNVFDNAAYNYAKTVCCLRLISIVKAASKDGFEGHASGAYPLIRSHHQSIIKFLTSAGMSFWQS